MKKKLAIILSVVLTIVLCICSVSCMGFARAFIDALNTQNIADRVLAYGDQNDISVTFKNGRMIAEWDTQENAKYKLLIKNGNDEKTFTDGDAGFSLGDADLTTFGYQPTQPLSLRLQVVETVWNGINFSTKNFEKRLEYEPVDRYILNKYTKPVSAGFEDIDYYIANRQEWFDFWSYLIIFRENCQIVDGCYELSVPVYMAYDYCELYDIYDYNKAFAYEVYSAVDAYEDSAAYNYSFEISQDGKEGEIYMKFLYAPNPKYDTMSAYKYENVRDNADIPHYQLKDKPIARNFPIDKIDKTASVCSSDQLYFALKKGYRPIPKVGSNADLLYKEMRSILARMIDDDDKDYHKAHLIYDYLVDTVIYDYEFSDNVYKDDNKGVSELFSYRCLYLEGVFGLGDNGKINSQSRVAICDGLSKAYLSLATIEGMDCMKISGTVSEEGHAWNKILINNVWYLVDTTWGNSLEQDTGKEYMNHGYLLVADDDSHVESKYHTYPKANHGRYRFGPGINNNPTGQGTPSPYPWFSWHKEPRYAA